LKVAKLKEEVWKTNLDIYKYNLVISTWGNASGVDRSKGIVVIKPSGVPYNNLKLDDMVVVDLEGQVIEGELKPSSDTPAHLELYKVFKQIGGITHTHSEYATIFAQARREIPCLGTTHADFSKEDIPLTRILTKEEVEEDYEGNTGKVIVERFAGLKPLEIPAVLVAGHGPFTWGKTPSESVENSLILEKIAKMAFSAFQINPELNRLPEYIRKKHYQRKYGVDAYYGQEKKGEKK